MCDREERHIGDEDLSSLPTALKVPLAICPLRSCGVPPADSRDHASSTETHTYFIQQPSRPVCEPQSPRGLAVSTAEVHSLYLSLESHIDIPQGSVAAKSCRLLSNGSVFILWTI